MDIIPKIMFIDDKQVAEREEALYRSSVCISNDHHIISLAQVSGARLLYSNDKRLQHDFKNRVLINNPHGKVYTTNHGRKDYSEGHKKLLRRRDLC